MLALIAAYAKDRIIGRDGHIPWDIPEDKHRFRDLTMGQVVVMGRRTYEEIGRPLPGRDMIVISRTRKFDGCRMARSLAQALHMADGRDVFICGGAQLYQEALPLADVLYLTRIDRTYDGDTRFPAFDVDAYVCTQRTEGKGDIPYTFLIYRRREWTYAQARDYIARLTVQKGIVLGLEPLQMLLHRLGDPQNRYPVVHIAGTNGKGSTLAMIAAMLGQSYRVGTYSSPAVFCERECWRVAGEMISEADYAYWMTRIHAVCAQMQAEGDPVPTAFEQETALAFCDMAKRRAQIAVVECGMGGAQDATNVVTTTAVSVITAVGMDHMKFLGDSIANIARAKGGIIKPGVPVVLQGQSTAVEREIAAICKQTGSDCTLVRDVTIQREDARSVTFSYCGETFSVSLPGSYQAVNAATAIAAVRQLHDFPLTAQAMRDGLRAVQWPGRMEQICDHPVIVLDGAHNPGAAERLREAVQRRFAGRHMVHIVGVLADKDFTAVARCMAPLADTVITVTPQGARALSAKALADCMRQFCDSVTVADRVPQALRLAKQAAGADGVIVAYGSLSWLHELREAVEEDT